MKTPKLHLTKILLLAFVATLLFACKKDKSQPLSITGKWVAQSTLSVTQVYQDIYQFNSDSTFTQSRVIANTADNQIVAYQYIATGKFHLNADQLQFYSIVAKSNDNYVPLTQMVTLAGSPVSVTYTVSIASSQTEFHFVFKPCGINENCVPQTIYYKR